MHSTEVTICTRLIAYGRISPPFSTKPHSRKGYALSAHSQILPGSRLEIRRCCFQVGGTCQSSTSQGAQNSPNTTQISACCIRFEQAGKMSTYKKVRTNAMSAYSTPRQSHKNHCNQLQVPKISLTPSLFLLSCRTSIPHYPITPGPKRARDPSERTDIETSVKPLARASYCLTHRPT